MVRVRQPANWWTAVLFLVGFTLLTNQARATAPRLTSILPLAAQRGTELEVTLSGERLQDAEEILCFEPGIQVLKLSGITNAAVKAQIKLAPDCALGEYHLRLRTASGLSEIMTFQVSPFPILDEQEPNNTREKAQKLALNTTVSGVITNEDVDCFSIIARKGERISAETQAIRLGRSALDARLTLMDSNGVILADVDDTWLGQQDPFFSIVAPSDGTYFIQLREVTYAGGDKDRYLLHVGSFPRVTGVFPSGGKVGETVKLDCYSSASGHFSQETKFPDAPNEKFGFFPALDGIYAPTPNWVRTSPFANILATGTNHTRDLATVSELQPPIALNGVISTKGQENWFRFPGTKGMNLEFEVYARRLRSPLDPVFELFDSAGKSLASNDDAAGADSSLKFTLPETTNYFVRIRDTLHEGGADYAYRMEITPVSPSINVKIPEVSRNDTQSRQFALVPKGNRFATLISAKRANVSGELVFDVPNLPQGVHLVSDRLAANVDSMPLVFEADSDAPITGKLLELTATGTNTSGNVVGKFRQRIELVEGPNNTSYYGTTVDKFCVAVAKEVPFHIRIVEPKVPLVQAGTMPLEIVAERAPGFDEAIELNMVWNPPGVSSQSEATIPKGASNVVYQLNANGGAETRTWKIAILGHANVEGGPVYVSSNLTPLEIAKPYLTGKIETLWANPGKSAKLTVNLEHPKAFEGKAVARLIGLPEKVTTTEKEITKDDQEVVFELSIDPKCSTGSHKNLFCAVEVKENGHSIPHNIAQGGILRIVPPKKEDARVAAVAGPK